ncbi:GNAT family N-acetyltransferase [Zavarzinia compransoris]|uniref:GNAT family N-acetyltransferase n=1 Tax=Zavarzinia marina TaxID=2911065 RepID=UPI001F1A13A4|nr:GNAT family N-acetyltransferase [Zavarzinia marina]MCF4164981.1 GNAT family N-acetyltransferase [Zavarzinia marina]
MTVLRPAEAGDLAAIEACVEAAYRPWVARIGREPGPMADDYAAAIAAGRVTVAVLASGVAGLLVLVRKDGEMLLDNVAVRPEAAGRGIGRALIAHAEGAARAAGLGAISLYTNARMVENVAFYERLGYRVFDRRVERGFDRIYMRKWLAPPGGKI